MWSADLDWGFPPQVCDSAWELDAIAEPATDANLSVLGDFSTAAALAVMRYEYLFTRALQSPSVLAQLCTAVGSVDPVRSSNLEVLESYLSTGSRRAEAANFPDEVAIVAASPTMVVAVACVMPGYATVLADDGEIAEAAQAPARLQSYLLTVSRGLEDMVTDISYRVSNAAHRPADDCEGLDSWTVEWDRRVQDWTTQGQIWQPVGQMLSAAAICESPPPEGPSECPRDWLQ